MRCCMACSLYRACDILGRGNLSNLTTNGGTMLDFDTWITTDFENEGDICDDHNRLIPCPLCQTGYLEDRMDEARYRLEDEVEAR